jgi:hypothetical protein
MEPTPLTNRPTPAPTPSSNRTTGSKANSSAGSNPGQRELQFPETRLTVTAWSDPVLDHLGHDPRSRYAERFWLPIVGPSCLLLGRRQGPSRTAP